MLERMLHWNPMSTHIDVWEPIGGWNRAFSEQDKLQATNLFFFFTKKKGFEDRVANVLVHMVLFKQKYPGLAYTEEQEQRLRNALQPVYTNI